MPVRLEHIHTPSAADWQDLEKIHQDTASDGFTLTQQQLQSWLDDGGWIMAGRFNDRLIGALLARRSATGVELSHAGVRTVTQRRGVMHQLLHFICRWSDAEQQPLQVTDCPEILQPALAHRQFRQQDKHWVYTPAG